MATTRILIVNGVNLAKIGTREVNVYGHTSFEEYLSGLRAAYPDLEIDYIQTDETGALCQALTNANAYQAVILNAGAYTHTSIILADAVRACPCDVIEVHISNLFGREQYRRNSELSAHCAGFICGFGLDGYRLAIEAAIKRKNQGA